MGHIDIYAQGKDDIPAAVTDENGSGFEGAPVAGSSLVVMSIADITTFLMKSFYDQIGDRTAYFAMGDVASNVLDGFLWLGQIMNDHFQVTCESAENSISDLLQQIKYQFFITQNLPPLRVMEITSYAFMVNFFDFVSLNRGHVFPLFGSIVLNRFTDVNNFFK